MQKPLLLLISGAPGSGKSTLAAKLAQQLGLYHVERDRLKFGIEYILDTPPEDRPKTVVPVYFKVLRALTELKISIIADGAHFAGKTEADLVGLDENAVVLNVHCRSENLLERIEARKGERAQINPESEQNYKPDLTANIAACMDPVDHSFPILEVDCNDGYEPALEEIVSWVRENGPAL